MRYIPGTPGFHLDPSEVEMLARLCEEVKARPELYPTRLMALANVIYGKLMDAEEEAVRQ